MKARKPTDYREALRVGRWFRGVPDAFQDSLLSAASLRSLRAGERLFSRGDPPAGLFGVVDGSVRVSATAEDGREALLTLAEPPAWFGEVSALDGLPMTHDATAGPASVLVHVPKPALDSFLSREPLFWRDLGRLAAAKLRLTFSAMEETTLLPLPVRLARRLALMAEGYGERTDRTGRVVEVGQEQLATMLGTSRQTVNLVLKDLEARGLVRVSYREIGILDLPRLKAEGRLPIAVDRPVDREKP